MKSIQDRVV